MADTKALIQASLQAGRAFFRPAHAAAKDVSTVSRGTAIIPIRSLGANHRARIARHLLALEPHDRYLRFGYSAQDHQILAYADALDFERDEIFGIYNRRLELIAMAHLAYAEAGTQPASAEFGVSVAKSARGKGFGARLFERAALHASNDGISLLYIQALSENTAMLRIARNAGATVVRDGNEAEAHLRLPPASLDRRATEFLDEQIALTDYRFKQQAKAFWRLLADWQQIKRDTVQAQKDCGS